MKRDFLAEILEKKNRLKSESSRFDHFLEQMRPLFDAYYFWENEIKDRQIRAELARYFPIRAVACAEGYFRLCFKDLIDAGEPFSINACEFKDIKFQVDSVLAIHSKKVSVGEFISHFLSAKNLKEINASMSTLIGEDFLARLKKTKINSSDPTTNISLEKGVPGLFGDIEKIYEIRHICCHEFASTIALDNATLARGISAFGLLVVTNETLIAELFAQKK
ncbi:MAG TPA: hypothetical protein VIK53_08660 [Verrucomicrobiae bacterium]